MPQTFPNYNPSGTLDGQATSVATIVGPGVTHPGQAIYLANADGTWGEQISGGGGGGQLPIYTDDSADGIQITETGAGGVTLTDSGGGGLTFSETAVSATIQISNSGVGAGNIEIIESSDATGGIIIEDAGSGGITITDSGSGGIVLVSSGNGGGIALDCTAAEPGGITIDDNSGGGIIITEHAHAAGVVVGAADGYLGFYSATPILQPAAPVTLGDVITALTNLGLVAS